MPFRIFLSPPDVGTLEREYLLRAFDSGWITSMGPDVEAFESEVAAFTGSAHAVALASGTAALHLALLAVGVDAGDKVLTSTLTFAATANAIVYCGAHPVFIDSETHTWNMDPDLLSAELADRSARNDLPAAVVVVDIFGKCADYRVIEDICRLYGVPLIEDAAEALGASLNGRQAGTFGVVGILSFNGNKIMTTSGGGMLMTEDPAIAARARKLSTQAREPVAHYEHLEVGFNYRLSNLLAAVGRAQLARLPDMISRRRQIGKRYRDRLAILPGVAFQPDDRDGSNNSWLTVMTTDGAVDGTCAHSLIARLGESGIEARRVWKPMHLQPVFRYAESRLSGVAEELFQRGVCLPSGSTLDDHSVDEVCDLLVGCWQDAPTVPTPRAGNAVSTHALFERTTSATW